MEIYHDKIKAKENGIMPMKWEGVRKSNSSKDDVQIEEQPEQEMAQPPGFTAKEPIKICTLPACHSCFSNKSRECDKAFKSLRTKKRCFRTKVEGFATKSQRR